MRATATTLETFTRTVPAVNAAALGYARNVALFAVAPLVALAYVVAFPVVGLAALAWMAVRAARERNAG